MISPQQLADLRQFVKQWRANQSASASVEELEQAATEVARVAGQAVMEEGLERVDEGHRCWTRSAPCGCGSRARFVTYRRRDVVSLYGTVRVRRAYHYCSRCGSGQFLWDQAQGLNGLVWTPVVKSLVAEVAGRLAYGEAVRLLERLVGLRIEESCAERIVLEVGGRLRAEESRRTALALAGELQAPKVQAGGREYVSIDATKAHIDGSWHDVKTALTYSAKAGADGLDKAVGPRYVAAQEVAERFGERLYGLAVAAGVAKASQVVVIGDGAEWIWNIASHHYPQATQILDIWHAREHIHALARAYYGEQSAKGRRWAKDHCRWLEERGPGTLLGALKRMKPATPEQAEAVHDQRRYFETNAGRMQYHRYRAAGMMIGSGPVEAACKTVVGGRLKRSGMRWSGAGADAILAIRCALLSNEPARLEAAARAA